MRCQAYKAAYYINIIQIQQVAEVETQEKRPFSTASSKLGKREFHYTSGRVKAAQGGALGELWACFLINFYVFFHALKFRRSWN